MQPGNRRGSQGDLSRGSGYRDCAETLTADQRKAIPTNHTIVTYDIETVLRFGATDKFGHDANRFNEGSR